MKIFNTLSRKKEELIALKEGEFKIYVCGPTVYNYIHVGNARPVIVFDILRRYLEYKGNAVNFVSNYTDIDDKIINSALKEGITIKELSEKFIKEFEVDTKGLNVLKSTSNPKATDNIDNIIDMVLNLEEKSLAYAVDGDVYFRTKKFDGYGKLSKQPLEDLEAGARIDVADKKEDPRDFALWKASKKDEPYWESPWGNGRPGWHIECSAMAKRYLGDTIDIHGGGQDLIFPHHENEIAQSEGANEKPFANYFMHNSYLNIDNKKMSKSEGNFFTVREVANKYGYEAIRYIIASSYYRSPVNYTEEVILQAKSSLERLYTFRDNLDFWEENSAVKEDIGYKIKVDEYKSSFIASMDDDLNTSEAISYIFEMVKDINSMVKSGDFLSSEEYIYVKKVFDVLVTDILGLLYNRKTKVLDTDIEKMIEDREKARKDKNYKLADEIRNNLADLGIKLEDTPQGIKWSRE